MLKYLFDLSVEAPQYLSPGTLIFPILSDSILYFICDSSYNTLNFNIDKLNWGNMTNFEKVKKFMQTFGQEVKSKPSFPNDRIVKLRYGLIDEELSELKLANILSKLLKK